MVIDVTKFILEGTNLVLKGAGDEIVASVPSARATIIRNQENSDYIYISDDLSDRNPTSEKIKVQVSAVTLPAGNWTQDTLIQELSDSFIGVGSGGGTVPTDLAKEATLQDIKTQTDQLVFTANKLRTTGEDASGGGSTPSNVDAGGRERVSQLTTLVDLKQVGTDLSLFYDTELNGAGASTYLVDESLSDLTVTNSGDYAIRQTKMRFNYQTGKSALTAMTFYDLIPEADVIKRAGCFTSNAVTPFDSNKDGFWLESSGGTIYAVVSNNGTETARVEQSNWDDPLDGTGVSGITINWANSQVFEPDFLWLGADQVRFVLKIGANIVIFHTVTFANNIQGVYMKNPSLPIRYEIRSTGGAGSFKQICATRASEGSINKLGCLHYYDSGNNTQTLPSSNQVYCSFLMRAVQDFEFLDVDILKIGTFADTNDDYRWEVVLNPTVQNQNAFAKNGDSNIEFSAGGNAQLVTDKGYIISGDFGRGNDSVTSQVENAIRLGMTIAGVRDVIGVIITPLSSNLQFRSSITYREVN